MELKEVLNWRYATKRYDPSKKVTEEDLQQILEAVNLSASSTGLQPFRVFVIDNPEIRAELKKDSFNTQITEASHLLAFAAFTKIEKQHLTAYIRNMAKIRNQEYSELAEFQKSIEEGVLHWSEEQMSNWSVKQTYIALGTGLIAAADLRVDSTPMEGFNADKLDALLHLKEKNLRSVVLLALGYRDESKDFLAGAKKVRLPITELVKKVG